MISTPTPGWRPVVASLILALASAAPSSATPGHRSHGKLSAKARDEAKAKGTAKIDVIVRFLNEGDQP